jgi:hypothetical protein
MKRLANNRNTRMSTLRSNDGLKPITAKYPWPSIKALLRTMAALALGYVLLLAYFHSQGDSDIRRIFGGSTGLSALKYADRIEAYRIGKPSDPDNWQGLLDFPITTGPITISQSEAETLRRTLQDRNSYLWDTAKGCIPVPGVRLDFIRGDDRLSVLLCFECDILENFVNGKFVGGEDFDNVRPILVRIVRSLFPDDPKIQSLPEQH